MSGILSGLGSGFVKGECGLDADPGEDSPKSSGSSGSLLSLFARLTKLCVIDWPTPPDSDVGSGDEPAKPVCSLSVITTPISELTVAQSVVFRETLRESMQDRTCVH
jgi:hypothetical protein